MKYRKDSLVILATIFAIVINLLGRHIASTFNLPFWFDSVGTLLIAYVYGPVCGGIVGLFNNIIYGIFVDEQSIYCLVGMCIGILTGILAKKGAYNTHFRVATLGAGLALLCTFIALPINILLYGGKVGNIWADQIILMCENNKFPRAIALIIAQLYIEFLDKLITVYIIYFIIRIFRCKDKIFKKKNASIASILALVILFSFFQSVPVYATNNNEGEDYNAYTHSFYGNSEGLLAGEANDIAQTKEGLLWIGTYAGLYNYDGVNFNLLNDIDSVKNVNELYVDEESRLWIGTNDSGVTIMINDHVMNVITTEDGLPSNTIKSIVCDSNGNYYIGSTSGVSIVSLAGGVRITKTFSDIRNTIKLVANNSGVVIGVTDDGKIYTFKDGELIDTNISDADDILANSAFFSKDEKLYIGTESDRVLEYSDWTGAVKEKEYICRGLNAINSFYENDNGEIFICSDSGVGYLNSNKEYNYINTDHFTSSIDDMLIDYQGNLWFASSRLGLLKLSKSTFTSLFTEIVEANHVVNTVKHIDNYLYCGTDDGLLIIDESRKTLVENELTELMDGVRIRHINVDSNGDIWISTTGSGLYKISLEDSEYNIENFTDSNGMPGRRVRGSIELSNGEIVAIGDEGVAFINDNTVTNVLTSDDGLVNVKSLCVLEYNGKVYVGSDGGGITIINNHKIEGRITKEEGLSSDVILKLSYDANSDGVFIITSNGLCYMSPENEIKYLNQFPYSNIFDLICSTDDNIWILSSAGIFRATSEQLIDNKTKEYELLNSKNGLLSSLTANSYSYIHNGMMYLCCDDDIVKFDFNEYNSSIKSYRMILNSVTVDGHMYEINRMSPLTIPADANTISFSPKILNYSSNTPYISYCLEGISTEDTVILLSDLDTITFNNLKPGRYVFRIAVLDSSKQNVIESARYIIIKDMYMYQNWWFRLYFIAVAALMLMWVTWFVTRSSIQKTILNQKLQLEYAQKQIKMGNETILSIARTVDAKDSNTSQHSFRVSEYSVLIAKKYGFDDNKCENIRQMALLHDIGKIGIPDAILNKPAKLNDEEYSVMKSHVLRGGEILKDFTLIDNVYIGALYHHERYDGKGYCSGLKGEDIPIEARIIGIADAFDAMTANRVYRKQLDIDYVVSELKRCKGTQFDPKITDIMLSLIKEGVIDVEALYKESKEGLQHE